METNSKAVEAVNDFFNGNETVFAIVDTDNHSANFYGDETICELTVDDVVSCIECAESGWNLEDYESATEIILNDLQHNRPDMD